MPQEDLLIYYLDKPADKQIPDFLAQRLRRNPAPYGLSSEIHKDILGNWEVSFSVKQEEGGYIPHATELIARGARRHARIVASAEGRELIRHNPGFLRKIIAANRQGKEVGEGWEGKVHEEPVVLIKDGQDVTEQVAVKYYFPMVLQEGEAFYDGVLYGVFTPAVDQMRALQYVALHQQKDGIFPGVHFVSPYFATLDISVAPLIPDAANLQKELREGLFINGHAIHNANISDTDKANLHAILVEQDRVLEQVYGQVDPKKRFTEVFSNAAYNIIRGITAWLTERKASIAAEGILVSNIEHVSFEDATQKNIVISIPAFCALYKKWAENPAIADKWIANKFVSAGDPLLSDQFLQAVRETAYVIEVMATGGVIGRVGDEDY